MTSRSQRNPGARFYPLLTRAQAEEQTAVKKLAEAQRLAAREHAKLQELKLHSERTHTPQPTQLSSALANRQAFMARLSQAIVQQKRQVAFHDQNVEQARQHWLAANHNTQRYQRLIENEIQRSRQLEAGREQKEMDEIALRRRRLSHHLAGS